MVRAPASLLLDPELTPAAKVLWLALRAYGAATPTRLAAASGLTLTTIRKGLPQLEAAGWYLPSIGPVERSPSAACPSFPPDLLAEDRVRHQAKLLYGILQTLPGVRDGAGAFTYASLGARTQLSLVTVRQVVWELARAGWIEAAQANQRAPIRFSLRIPEQDRVAAAVAQAKLRLLEAQFRGEAIMKEYLSLMIDSDEFEDNARPGFLINPLTDERMELDRYYPPLVGFEFHGAQHFRTTERFPSQKALTMRQARDLMKEALCARRGVRVVVFTSAELNIETIRQKVGSLLPLRDLCGQEELVRYLERVSRSYL